MAASFGKMPTTLVRRLISLLTCSSGLVEWILARCSLGKVMKASRSLSASSIKPRQLLEARPQAVGDLTPLVTGGHRGVLYEGGADRGGHHLPPTLRHVRQGVAA